MLTQNQLIVTFPGTYYFSYVTEQTHALQFSHHYWPDIGMNPMLFGCSAFMGMPPFGATFYSGFNGDEWRENDGALPSYFQMHPRIPSAHPAGGEFTDRSGDFKPGKWYWQYLHDRDHLDVVMLLEPWQIAWQKMFYSNLFNRLADLSDNTGQGMSENKDQIGITLDEALNANYIFSGKLSDFVRRLGFAGYILLLSYVTGCLIG